VLSTLLSRITKVGVDNRAPGRNQGIATTVQAGCGAPPPTTPPPTPSPTPCPASTVGVSLTLDNYPGETTWTLKDACNTAIVFGSGGPYASAGTTANESVCAPAGARFQFTINDTWGEYNQGGGAFPNNPFWF